MTLIDDARRPENTNVALDALPSSAIQAIYHAATGKTENLSKPFIGNVVIDNNDIVHLHELITEQLQHYDLKAPPTETIIVKDAAHKASTYSSWSRFEGLRTASREVTSELLMKTEFIMLLPGTTTPQRCVISISMDSALPVLCKDDYTKRIPEDLLYFLFSGGGFKVVEVSIDFVDFLVAKNFMSHVEEWFKSLKPTPQHKLSKILVSNSGLIRVIASHAGRVGLAAFLLAYVYINHSKPITVEAMISVAGISVLLMAAINVIQSRLSIVLNRRIMRNLVPAVVLLDTVDHDEYNKLIDNLNSPLKSLFMAVSTVVLSIVINVASSFLYTWITTAS